MGCLKTENSDHYLRELHILAKQPQLYVCYTSCYVNGVKYVIWDRDHKLKSQNSGVMVDTGDQIYYGVLENVLELRYTTGMAVVLFKCLWFNTGPSNEGGCIKIDRYGIISIDTSTTWYEDAPYCLATTVTQVFYLDDPTADNDHWKVVNVVAQRGTYSTSSLALKESSILPQDEAYQEATTYNIVNHVPANAIQVDLGSLPQSPPHLYHGHFRMESRFVCEDDEWEEIEEDEEEDDELDNIEIEYDDQVEDDGSANDEFDQDD